jgi:hypothetical protein
MEALEVKATVNAVEITYEGDTVWVWASVTLVSDVRGTQTSGQVGYGLVKEGGQWRIDLALENGTYATPIPTPTPTPVPTPTLPATFTPVVSAIDGKFEGFEPDRIYVLLNGQVWQQTSYEYEYHYSYAPRVTISLSGGQCVMAVEGMSRFVYVVQVEAIQSRIDGQFSGLDYGRIYTLQNGQVWQQKEFYIWYYYWYAPTVIIYRSHSGSWMMKVEGISHAVRVERIR